MNIADELQKLQTLRDSGALTDEEFAEAKAQVLKGAPDASGSTPNLAIASTDVLRKFTRSKRDCWIGGVCGGLGNLTPLPTWCWRLGFAVLIFCYGVGLIPYILLWIFVPEEDGNSQSTNS